MELVMPNVGLIFWMTLTFGLILFLLGKYAWKPIMKGIHEREQTIETAIHAADQARKEIADMKVGNEQLMREAKEERDAMMREARQLKDKIIEEARQRAAFEADRILETAREDIRFEKLAVLNELKSEVAAISIEIAEKLLVHELSDRDKQHELAARMLNELKMN